MNVSAFIFSGPRGLAAPVGEGQQVGTLAHGFASMELLVYPHLRVNVFSQKYLCLVFLVYVLISFYFSLCIF